MMYGCGKCRSDGLLPVSQPRAQPSLSLRQRALDAPPSSSRAPEVVSRKQGDKALVDHKAVVVVVVVVVVGCCRLVVGWLLVCGWFAVGWLVGCFGVVAMAVAVVVVVVVVVLVVVLFVVVVGRWMEVGWEGSPPYFIAHTDACHIITAPGHLLFFVFFFHSISVSFCRLMMYVDDSCGEFHTQRRVKPSRVLCPKHTCPFKLRINKLENATIGCTGWED